MKKWLLLILTAILTMGLIVGCSNDSVNGTKDQGNNEGAGTTKNEDTLSGKITVWTFFSQVKDMAEQFMKKYPNVEVEVQVFPGDEYQTKLLTALQSGNNVPDIFDLERGYIGKFINSKYLADLSAMGGEDLVKDYVPYVQELGRDSKGTLRAISDHSSPGGLWYIKENAKKWLGTDDPEEISAMVDSWDKIIELGKKVYEESNGKVHLIDNYGSVNDVFAYNTEPWVKDGKLNIDPKWLEAYEIMEEIFTNKVDAKLPFMSAGWGNALNDGSVVFCLAPAWAQFMIDNDGGKAVNKYGVAKPPMGYYQGGTYRAIYEGSDNKELAYKFIEYIAGSEWQQWNLENNGNMPGLLTVYEDNLETFKSEVFGDQNILKPYYELVKSLPPVKADQYGEEILSKWRKISSEGIQNGQDIDEVLKRFKSEVKNTFPELEVE
jgi:multiple sugar transport system substrate-binding protein